MSNCIAIGFTSFKLNLKRSSFLVFALLLSMIFGVFMYRRGTSPEFINSSVMMLSKFMGYYLVFMSAEVFSKEFQNGFYKCVHTSGMSEGRIILYKTISVLFTALLFFVMVSGVHLMVITKQSADADIKMLGKGALIFLIVALHYSSAAALLTALLNRYKATLFSMLICYIALPYVYTMYRAFTGRESELVRAIPCVSMDYTLMTYDIRMHELVINLVLTAVFFVMAMYVAKNKDIKADSSEE